MNTCITLYGAIKCLFCHMRFYQQKPLWWSLSLRKLPEPGEIEFFWGVMFYICIYVVFVSLIFFEDIHFWGGTCLFFFFLSALLPVLHHKAKKGPPRQAKYAIHCINAIFSSKETQFAQIFEVKMKIFFFLFIFYSTYVN